MGDIFEFVFYNYSTDRLKRVKAEGRGLLAICKIACFVCYCSVNITSGPNTTIVFLSCATDLINTFFPLNLPAKMYWL